MVGKKLLSITLASLILFNSGVVNVLAFSAPTPPPAPTEPTPPPAPTSQPTPPPAPTTAPTPKPTVSPTPKPTATPKPSPSPATSPDQGSTTGSTAAESTGVNQNSNTGTDNTIATGDATNTAGSTTTGNTNTSATPQGEGSGVTVVNSENGSGSTNTGSVNIVDENTTSQTNSADITSSIVQSSDTGNNSASRNTGGDNSITTGDANTTGTLITSVNTNVAGIMVSEFNIADSHVGDYVLDFDAYCISGCEAQDLEVQNINNGSGSVNVVDLNLLSNDVTFQNNDATVANSMVLDANSGENTASRNTGGDSNIVTGDANVAANSLTFVNNNIAGNVIYGVVNIFGDLVGDILMPAGFGGNSCCGQDVIAKNAGNGDGSTNIINYDSTVADNYVQFNELALDNLLYLDANTGGNQTTRNTSGDNSITTGDASATAQVVNIANNNLVGGDWWLVIVNEAGNWIGKIFGSPSGSWFGASEGLAINSSPAGELSVMNSGNGSDSTNVINVNQEQSNNVTQINSANIVNDMKLSANTGGNDASRNTGGSSDIATGDANIIANIVNFANNNITGGGRLFVTVVNVFGSWLGDFLSPGSKDVLANNNDSSETGIGGYEFNAPAISQTNTSELANNSEQKNEDATLVPTLTSLNSNRNSSVASYSKVLGDSEQGIEVVASANAFDGQVASGDDKDTIKINFAWVLLAAPLALVGMMIIKRFRHA